MSKYRKKPVVIDAILWSGSNTDEVRAFAGFGFEVVAPHERDRDSDIAAEVWDHLHDTWVGVKIGQWIIRGVQGEFYPCDAEVFDVTYDKEPE